MPISEKLQRNQTNDRNRGEAIRSERRHLTEEDRERWKASAEQCGCEFRRGVNGVIHQEGIPAEHYIREDELPTNRDSGLAECDPAENRLYLQQSAKSRALKNDELNFQDAMRESAEAKRARQRRAERFATSGNVYTAA